MAVKMLDIVCFIDMLILTLLSCICLSLVYSYHQLSFLPEIGSRKPRSSTFIGLLSALGLLLTYPLTILFLNVAKFPEFPYNTSLIAVLVLCTNIGIYHVFTYRAWIVYFDIKWNKALEDKKWRLHIDPNESNWFLKNRHTFWGNPRKIGIALFIHISLWASFIFVFIAIKGDKGPTEFFLGMYLYLDTKQIEYITYEKKIKNISRTFESLQDILLHVDVDFVHVNSALNVL